MDTTSEREDPEFIAFMDLRNWKVDEKTWRWTQILVDGTECSYSQTDSGKWKPEIRNTGWDDWSKTRLPFGSESEAKEWLWGEHKTRRMMWEASKGEPARIAPRVEAL